MCGGIKFYTPLGKGLFRLQGSVGVLFVALRGVCTNDLVAMSGRHENLLGVSI